MYATYEEIVQFHIEIEYTIVEGRVLTVGKPRLLYTIGAGYELSLCWKYVRVTFVFTKGLRGYGNARHPC